MLKNKENSFIYSNILLADCKLKSAMDQNSSIALDLF